MTYEYRYKEGGSIFEIMATIAGKAAGLRPVGLKCGSSATSQVFGGFGILSVGNGSSGSFSSILTGCGPAMDVGCC